MSYSLREINEQIRSDPQGFAQRSDNAYTEKVRRAAQKIAARRRESHIVLLSGPSGSGKTTTAKKIEAKLQETSGSAFEKLSYALDDCMAAPIPSIIVFSGRYIRDDMKAKLISSGHGIEVGYENGAIADRYELLKQRIYIELGMNYFPFLRP